MTNFPQGQAAQSSRWQVLDLALIRSTSPSLWTTYPAMCPLSLRQRSSALLETTRGGRTWSHCITRSKVEPGQTSHLCMSWLWTRCSPMRVSRDFLSIMTALRKYLHQTKMPACFNPSVQFQTQSLTKLNVMVWWKKGLMMIIHVENQYS